MKRHGFSLSLVIVFGGALLLCLIALSNYSSQETRAVQKMLARRKAEAAARSGLNWAAARLARNLKGRWYQPPRASLATDGKGTRWAWSAHAAPDLFPPDSGMSVDVFLDEQASTRTIEVAGVRHPLLDRIRIFALGSSDKEQCLFSGSMIFSPEPLLNSDETEGVLDDILDLGDEPTVVVPEVHGQSSAVPTTWRVAALRRRVGDTVAETDIVAEIERTDSHGQLVRLSVTAGYQGVVRQVFVREKQVVCSGAALLSVARVPFPRLAPTTLKRLVDVHLHAPDTVAAFNLAHKADRCALHRATAVERLEHRPTAVAMLEQEKTLLSLLKRQPPRLNLVRLRQELAAVIAAAAANSVSDNDLLLRRLERFNPWNAAIAMPQVNVLVYPEAVQRQLRPDIHEALDFLSAMQERDVLIEIETGQTTLASAPEMLGIKPYLNWFLRQNPIGEPKPSTVALCQSVGEMHETILRVTLPLQPKEGIAPEAIARGAVDPAGHFHFSGHDRYYMIPRPEEIVVERIAMPVWVRYSVQQPPGSEPRTPFEMRITDLLGFLCKEICETLPEVPASDERTAEGPRSGLSNVTIISGSVR